MPSERSNPASNESSEGSPLRVLVFEADSNTANTVMGEIRKYQAASEVTVVSNGGDLVGLLEEFDPGLIVVDPSLPTEGSGSVIGVARLFCPGVPVIFVSDIEGEEAAVEALREGASDYFFRGRLGRLKGALAVVLREADERNEKVRRDGKVRISDARHRYFLDQTMEGFYRIDFDPPIPTDLDLDELVVRMYTSGAIVECNRVFAQMYGYETPESMSGVRLVDIHGGSDVPENVEALREFVRAGFRHLGVETVEVGADGEPIYLLNNSVGIVEEGFYICCWGTQRDITEQRRAEDEVRDSREQLRALAAKIRQAQEDERRQCSRLIHDELGQLLTGVKMDVRWLEGWLSGPDASPALNPLLDRAVAASELVDQTIAAVQQIASKIRPGILDQLGLAEALRASARSFGERFEIPVTAKVDLSEGSPDLPAKVANELFYICQEALTNIARHADAGAVEIGLRMEGGEIVLEVSDDGVGIAGKVDGTRRSLGILGMEERAFGCGGTVEIGSTGALGTRVVARIPLGGKLRTKKKTNAGAPC